MTNLSEMDRFHRVRHVSVAHAVERALSSELAGGTPTAEHIALKLGLHPKTLSRRLRDEGKTFRDVLDALRLRLARAYLQEPDLSVDQIARLLGYSEKSAFSRAYRRWTGAPPRSSPPAAPANP